MSQITKEKAAITLEPEELAALDEGILSETASTVYSLEESIEFARKRRKAWMRAPESLSA
jgi:hypothetical protein